MWVVAYSHHLQLTLSPTFRVLHLSWGACLGGLSLLCPLVQRYAATFRSSEPLMGSVVTLRKLLSWWQETLVVLENQINSSWWLPPVL